MVHGVGAEAVVVISYLIGGHITMEMLFVLGLALLAMAFIDRQHAAMRRVEKARVKEDARRNN